jgi:hypothetical protein
MCAATLVQATASLPRSSPAMCRPCRRVATTATGARTRRGTGCASTAARVMGPLLITCVPRSRHATKLNFKRRAFKPCSLSSSSPVRSFNEHEPLLSSKAGRVVAHEVTLTNLLLWFWFHKFMRSWRGGSADHQGRERQIRPSVVGVADRHRNGICHL